MKTQLSVGVDSSIISQRQLRLVEAVLTIRSTQETERGNDSLRESDRCHLQQYTFRFSTFRSSISRNSLRRLGEVPKRCSLSSTRVSNQSTQTLRTTTYTLSLCSHRPRLPSSHRLNSPTRRSATLMTYSMDTNKATSLDLHRRTGFGQEEVTPVPSRSISSSLRREAKTSHLHPSTKTYPPSNITPHLRAAVATPPPSPKVTNRRSSRT